MIEISSSSRSIRKGMAGSRTEAEPQSLFQGRLKPHEAIRRFKGEGLYSLSTATTIKMAQFSYRGETCVRSYASCTHDHSTSRFTIHAEQLLVAR